MITLDTPVEQETKMDNKQEALIMALNFLQVSCFNIHIQIHVYRRESQHTRIKVMLHVAVPNMCNKYVIEYSFV